MKRVLFTIAASATLAGCGQSPFAREMMTRCEEAGSRSPVDCGCAVGLLEQGLTAQQKAAFVPLRWPMRLSREENSMILRGAGIDPTNERDVDARRRELRHMLNVLGQAAERQCARR